VTHRSLFDGTVQGLQRTDKPAFCFQGHPEASPGPHDVSPLFDKFIQMMEQFKAQGTEYKVKATPETSYSKH
jgi:carbamoyl-phosphate synthase small subunit